MTTQLEQARAGKITQVMQAVARGGATLLPIDSEHNAIFQCLPGGSRCGIASVGVERDPQDACRAREDPRDYAGGR